jgi:hypothetical protein
MKRLLVVLLFVIFLPTVVGAQIINGRSYGYSAPQAYNGWGYQPGYQVNPGMGWNRVGGIGNYWYRNTGGRSFAPYNYYNSPTYGYPGYRYPRQDWYVPYGW